MKVIVTRHSVEGNKANMTLQFNYDEGGVIILETQVPAELKGIEAVREAYKKLRPQLPDMVESLEGKEFEVAELEAQEIGAKAAEK